MCIKTDILSTLTYFDLFHYPITLSEIVLFSRNIHKHAEVSYGLQLLLQEKRIYQFDDFFTLLNDPSLISRRRSGNCKAKSLLQTAEKIAKLLSCFPFVKGVAVSGSLSKNYADENSDIDLFIITTKNRLWLARTFMHCLKKASYLLKKEQLFCMNYYIDEAALEIREKNIYTATEVATLLPLRGIDAFEAFYRSNTWSRAFLPNHSMRISYVKDIERSFVKRFCEACLDNSAGNLLDTALMKLTAYRWREKTRKGKLNNRGIVMSMEASKHYAKPDPRDFQEKLVGNYEQRIFQLTARSEKALRAVF